MADKEYKHSELTGKIIGCAMSVHSALGSGFREIVYQRALGIEMADQGIAFQREPKMRIYYKGQKVGSRRVDFLVEDLIPVELKALIELEDVHLAQALNYLEVYNLEIGLLINFGSESLKFRRLLNKKFKET